MNKLFILILFFFSFHCKAIDSLTTEQKKAQRFTEKDLVIDSQKVTPTHFENSVKEDYSSEDFQYEEKIPEKSAWDHFKEWLRKLIGRLFGVTAPVAGIVVVWILYGVAIIVVALVIYFIVKSMVNKEGQWIFSKSSSKRIINYDDIERNLKDIDFDKLIKDTLKLGDNRLAIRYYYLWILKKMAEKDIIDWNPEKTNSDYLYEIKSNTLKTDFSYVSYLYNYIWYGEFEVDQTSFESAKHTMEKTLQSL